MCLGWVFIGYVMAEVLINHGPLQLPYPFEVVFDCTMGWSSSGGGGLFIYFLLMVVGWDGLSELF